MGEVRVIKHVPHTAERPDYFEVCAGSQEPLLLDLDEARKLRDALCIMVGMPSKRKKAPDRSQES